jgi:hypothetical protein
VAEPIDDFIYCPLVANFVNYRTLPYKKSFCNNICVRQCEARWSSDWHALDSRTGHMRIRISPVTAWDRLVTHMAGPGACLGYSQANQTCHPSAVNILVPALKRVKGSQRVCAGVRCTNTPLRGSVVKSQYGCDWRLGSVAWRNIIHSIPQLHCLTAEKYTILEPLWHFLNGLF